MNTLLRLAGIAGISLLTACTPPSGPGEINDPFEARNREVHEANKQLDRTFMRPGSQRYGRAVPKPVRAGIENFSDNLSLPGMVVNSVLQLRLDDAAWNAGRFLFNSTIGLAGVFDPASDIGITERKTDFGETLHVWGFREGAYLELPVLGPSTERDAIGKVVDIALNPIGSVLTYPEAEIAAAAGIAARVGDRYDHSELIDSILYDSADSYAQARILYLQNRRFELGGSEEPDYYDPYEDPYGE
ncbi:VacJ family lipoprotein [Actibacterium sp. MT2.3-13A]|uniref:MlaA family lipoprotein n=1 Tax=Actibacterium sp. MT2.3-13A TaxID=2828332 RepID=UPI001BA70F45|nr:VacJ family lipoprotein [Actibacterium sp. MT2.3-13A]